MITNKKTETCLYYKIINYETLQANIDSIHIIICFSPIYEVIQFHRIPHQQGKITNVSRNLAFSIFFLLVQS